MARKNILINSGAAGIREVAENSLNSNFIELYARSGTSVTSDATLSYITEDNPNGSVSAGDLLGVWEVAASGASDHHATTAGGVKLYEAGPDFSTRARLVAAHDRNVAASRTIPGGTVWSWPDFSVVLMPAGHAAYGTDPIADLAGWAPNGDVFPDHLKDNTTPGTTDMGATINAAIDYLDDLGGGILHFKGLTYLTSVSITPSRNIELKGVSPYFMNDYKNTNKVYRGTWIKLASGSNTNVFDLLTNVTDLFENSFPRAHIKLTSIGIDGNRSDTAMAGLGHLHNNSSGNCIRVRGLSYLTMEDVFLYRAAENGITTGSYDYGDGNGARGCNNFHFRNVKALLNEEYGFNLYAGDSDYSNIVAGANGLSGLRAGSGNFNGVLAWNNKGDGIRVSLEVRVYNAKSYDNDHAGYAAVGGGNHVLIGGEISDNGVAVSGNAYEQCGVFVDNTVTSIVIDGLTIFDDDAGNQTRGIYSDGAGPDIILGANDIHGHSAADVAISDYTTTYLHGPSGSTVARHPGFTLTGLVDANDNSVRNLEGVTFNGWSSRTSLTSGELAVGNDSLVSANIAAGGTVTDLSAATDGLAFVMIRNANSTPLTFQHSTSKLRLIGGEDVVLNQYEAIIFADITGAAWQQVGGKVPAVYRTTGTGSVAGSTSASGMTVLDASEAGAMWRVTAWHNSGQFLGETRVLGHATTPVLLASTIDDSGSADTFAWAVSGTNIVIYNSNDTTSYGSSFVVERLN